eukprot:TRINITY_DN8109_c0_g1_i3.p1 TRINITY_DN8109_c0_g1~~TRINITY_DN8109_c0_g1_i3.p1  ORF type:complete len:459 (-),score=87.58 TRINITY_DN8109_c0_g1_i3:259-1635(-)
MEFQNPSGLIKLTKKQCPISSVTVYNDRAEVTRTIHSDLLPDLNKLVLSGLTNRIDKDSIRVSGGKSSREVNILEVSCNSTHPESNLAMFTDKLDKAKAEQDLLKEEAARIESQKTWLEGFAEAVKSPNLDKGSTLDLLSSDHLKNVQIFLKFYTSQKTELDSRLKTVKKKIEEGKFLLLSELGAPASPEQQYQSEIVVEVKASNRGEAELDLSYIVTGASWVPSYDARVTSESDVVEVSYYGNITNSSGEDWKEVALHLSTATPSVAGKPPALYGLTVDLKNPGTSVPSSAHVITRPQRQQQPRIQRAVYSSFASSPFPGGFNSNTAPQGMIIPQGMNQTQLQTAVYSTPDVFSGDSEETRLVEAESMAPKGITSTSFTIQRKVTINSDSKPHKVTIQQVPLRARFFFFLFLFPSHSLSFGMYDFPWMRERAIDISAKTLQKKKSNFTKSINSSIKI